MDEAGINPRSRVQEAARAHGDAAVAQWCAGLLSGQIDFDDPEQPPLEVIGGPHAVALLAQGDIVGPGDVSTVAAIKAASRESSLGRRGNDYWVRVWAARGLLYVWDGRAAVAVVDALDDPAWRVREMSAKVVRKRELGEAADRLAELTEDPVARVRVAALRALALVGEGEHAEVLRSAEQDSEAAVRHAAVLALETLSHRLERPL